MIIVGLTGSIGSGKTTFAQFMADQTTSHTHLESWEIIAEVANKLRAVSKTHPKPGDFASINEWLKPVPMIVESVCHKPVDYNQIVLTELKLQEAPYSYAKLFEYLELIQDRPELQNMEIIEDSKETFRSLLQWLGGYFVTTIGTGIWYDEIVRRINQSPAIEFASVGGVRFPGDARRITNAGGKIIMISRPSIDIQDASEITERERALIVPDATVINNAGLLELSRCASKVMKDLQNVQLALEYSTAEYQA